MNSEYHNLSFMELRLGNLDRARELMAQGRERVFLQGYHSFLPYVGVAAVAALGDAGFAPAYAAGAALTDTEAFGLTWAAPVQ